MPVLDLPGISTLSDQLQQVRKETDDFFAIIKPEALYDRPIDARHRVMFYIGHLEGFDSILICRETLGVPSPDPALDKLFQAGIDPDSGNLPTDQPSDWPTLDRIYRYVNQCREHVDLHLAEAPQDMVQMAVEHRLMHLETLAYMFHNFPYERKQRSFEQEVQTAGETPTNEWAVIPAGSATLGQPKGRDFGWDNEFDEWTSRVPAFRIQRNSVSNGEYLEFVKQGGALPQFWTERNGTYYLRGMFAEYPLPLDWPVYVTQAQATAYAQAIGASVPTEAQFHRAAYGTPHGVERAYPWGSQGPAPAFGNFDFRRWDPEPVWMNPGESAFGVNQLVGNAWQWTSTPFGPFPGFEPRREYPGYSANFFDGEHFVMKGGSPRTGAHLLRRSFRNWFRRDYPYMYAGFRCVRQD